MLYITCLNGLYDKIILCKKKYVEAAIFCCRSQSFTAFNINRKWLWLLLQFFSACLGSRTWGQKSHFPFLLEPGRRCFLCPWDKIKKEEELVELGDGSWIDPSTCPPGMNPPVTHQGKQAPWHGEIFMHRSSYTLSVYGWHTHTWHV